MILFLQNDTAKEHPVGFEKSRINLFDPTEDEYKKCEHNKPRYKYKVNSKERDSPIQKNAEDAHSECHTKSLKNFNIISDDVKDLEIGSSSQDDDSLVLDDNQSRNLNKTKSLSRNEHSFKARCQKSVNETSNLYENMKEEKNLKLTQQCLRKNCDQPPRFDSEFCSDSCGVSALESDLLLSLKLASKMHPCRLRS